MTYLDLIGRPFKYGGRPDDGPNAPLDCYGLVIEVGRRQGVNYPPRSFSKEHRVNAALMASQMNVWKKCEPEPGAVVLFKIRGVACHVGVVVDHDKFIHTWEASGGVVVERLSEWQRRIVGFYRYVG